MITVFFTGLFAFRAGQNYPAAGELIARDADGPCSRKANPDRMSACGVQAGPDVIFHTDMEWLPAHKRGRTCCFHNTKLLLPAPGRQWPEENNLMTQEYAGMSTGRGRGGKCRYSTGAKIFLLLLAVSTVAALSGLYKVLTY